MSEQDFRVLTRKINYLLYKQYVREAGGQPYLTFANWLRTVVRIPKAK